MRTDLLVAADFLEENGFEEAAKELRLRASLTVFQVIPAMPYAAMPPFTGQRSTIMIHRDGMVYQADFDCPNGSPIYLSVSAPSVSHAVPVE